MLLQVHLSQLLQWQCNSVLLCPLGMCASLISCEECIMHFLCLWIFE